VRKASWFAIGWVTLWSFMVGCRCGDPARPVVEDLPSRPHVLFVVLDTVRADRLSLHGHPAPTSPHLEALAAEGQWFRHALSPGMWTVPSHASLFTGLPVTTHGVSAKRKWLDHGHTTLAEALRDAGYATWLLSANPFLQAHTNLVQGFDAVRHPWKKPLRRAATRHTLGKLHPDDASNSLGPKWQPGRYDSGRSVDRAKDMGPVAAEALGQWLDTVDGPWFAFVNLMEAHTPRVPSQASREAVSPGPEAIARQLRTDQSDGTQLAYTVGKQSYEAPSLEAIAQTYDAAVRDADAALGALVDTLRARGLLDDTLIVVTSDHGEHLGEHGLLGHKFSVYSPLVHVPLVLRHPATVPVGVRDEVVSTLGIMATILARAGVDLPEGTASHDLLQPDPYLGQAGSELVAATPRALSRLAKVHPDFDPTPWLRTWSRLQDEGHTCLERSDGHLALYDWRRDPLEASPQADAAQSPTCRALHTWVHELRAYDPSLAGPEDPAVPHLPDDMKSRLEALGYVDP